MTHEPGDGSTIDPIAKVLACLAPQDLDRFLTRLTPSEARRQRLNRRDELIRTAMSNYSGELDSIAAFLRELSAFRSGTYQHSANRDDEWRAMMRAILTANRGKLLGKRQVQNILAGGRTPAAK